MRKVQYPPEDFWQGFSSGKKRENDFYFGLLNNSWEEDTFLCLLSFFKSWVGAGIGDFRKNLQAWDAVIKAFVCVIHLSLWPPVDNGNLGLDNVRQNPNLRVWSQDKQTVGRGLTGLIKMYWSPSWSIWLSLPPISLFVNVLSRIHLWD